MPVKTQGLSGPALFLAAGGALIAYAGIKGSSPLTELRTILSGRRPEPLSTASSAEPLASAGSVGAAPAAGGKANVSTRDQPHVAAEMRFISSTWGITTNGWRAVAADMTGHPAGLAIDAMTTNKGTGDAIAAHYVQNARAKRVKYIIWWGRSWNPSRNTWVLYTGASPHKDHVHISFYAIGNPRAI